MTTIKNNGEGKPYYTQRNNRLSPASACNVTAMIAALSAAGWDVDRLAPAGVQPEDDLMQFLRTDARVQKVWMETDPAGKYPPNEWHAVLAYGTNLWLAERARLGFRNWVDFHLHLTAKDFAAAIDSGGAVVASGNFELRPGRPSGHVVAVTGYIKQDTAITSFLLDDSWGNYHDYYLDYRGKAVKMSMDDFVKILKYPGGPLKMGYIVRRAA